MDGVIKRAIRLSRTDKVYLLALTGVATFTTNNIKSALDFTDVDDNQVNFVMQQMIMKGYDGVHLVTYGLQFVDEYGVERFYEKPCTRSHIDDLMAVIEDDYNALVREDD